MKQKPESIFQSALRKMPTLRHSIPGQPFNLANSEVVAWLVVQPAVLQWLYDKARYSGRIVYDESSGTWHGASADETEVALGKWREAKRKKKPAVDDMEEAP